MDQVDFGPDTVPENFTICSLSRCTSSSCTRVLNSLDLTRNWFLGQYYSSVGVTYFGVPTYHSDVKRYGSGFKTSGNFTAKTNWVAMCAQNGITTDVVYANGMKMPITSAYPGVGKVRLGINSAVLAQNSFFGVAEVSVWNKILTPYQVQQLSQHYVQILNGGISQSQEAILIPCEGTCNPGSVKHCTANGTAVCCDANSILVDDANPHCYDCTTDCKAGCKPDAIAQRTCTCKIEIYPGYPIELPLDSCKPFDPCIGGSVEFYGDIYNVAPIPCTLCNGVCKAV